MSPAAPVLRLELRGRAAATLSEAQGALRDALQRGGVTSAVIARAELLFEEAALNVLRHGFPPEDTPEATVLVTIQDGGCALDIEDRGRPFDPTTAPLPAASPDLERARIGGLGLPLIRRMASSLAYRREGDGRNRLRIVVAPVSP